jgi:hypothetical protein
MASTSIATIGSEARRFAGFLARTRALTSPDRPISLDLMLATVDNTNLHKLSIMLA